MENYKQQKMAGNSSEYFYSLSSIIKYIKSFFIFLLGRWYVLVLAAVIGIALGFGYYKMKKPEYPAIATFILEEKSAGGGLAGIASQFGFDLGSLSGGSSLFAGDNILDILKSRAIVQKVLLSKVDSSKGTNSETLADLFLDFSKWKKNWQGKADLADLNYRSIQNEQQLSLKQDSVIGLIHQSLVKKSLTVSRLNKKGSIIQVRLASSNQVFSKLLVDRILEESKLFYTNIKTGNAQQNVNRLQQKADSLVALLNNRTYEAAGSMVVDGNPALRTLNVPSELKSREKTVVATLYAEIVKNLELSRISLSQQTPIIQNLDTPVYPLVDESPSLFKCLVMGFFSITAVVLVVLAMNFARVNKFDSIN